MGVAGAKERSLAREMQPDLQAKSVCLNNQKVRENVNQFPINLDLHKPGNGVQTSLSLLQSLVSCL